MVIKLEKEGEQEQEMKGGSRMKEETIILDFYFKDLTEKQLKVEYSVHKK